MKLLILLLLSGLNGLSPSGGLFQSDTPHPAQEKAAAELATGLDRPAGDQRVQSATDIQAFHDHLVRELITRAEQPAQRVKDTGDFPREPACKRDTAKHLAIVLLGEMRSEEAIPVLLDNIDYRVFPPDGNVGLVLRADIYPAVYALIQIGRPAAEQAILCLATEQNPERVDDLCIVLHTILGDAAAAEKIRVESDKPRPHEQIDRLNAAAEKLSHRQAPASQPASVDLSGEYKYTWQSPNNNDVSGTAEVKRNGDVYDVLFHEKSKVGLGDPDPFHGIGLQTGNQLSISYQLGRYVVIDVLVRQPDGVLRGKWSVMEDPAGQWISRGKSYDLVWKPTK